LEGCRFRTKVEKFFFISRRMKANLFKVRRLALGVDMPSFAIRDVSGYGREGHEASLSRMPNFNTSS
jgi:hypothetical protein